MSTSFWRISTDTSAYEAADLSGAGAKKTGGRWNDVGIPMVYSASSRALAVLETVVHLNAGALPLNRYLVEISMPSDVLANAEEADADALVGWDAEPAGRASVMFGTDWANSKRNAVLLVPSVIVPEEQNFLINPLHPAASDISARKIRKWLYDPRIRR